MIAELSFWVNSPFKYELIQKKPKKKHMLILLYYLPVLWVLVSQRDCCSWRARVWLTNLSIPDRDSRSGSSGSSRSSMYVSGLKDMSVVWVASWVLRPCQSGEGGGSSAAWTLAFKLFESSREASEKVLCQEERLERAEEFLWEGDGEPWRIESLRGGERGGGVLGLWRSVILCSSVALSKLESFAWRRVISDS